MENSKLRPVPGTEEYHACDTLILSVGLIPENELSLDAGVMLDKRTGGADVDERYQTSVPGIFAAGNVLQVHDLADLVSEEAEALADAVGRYLSEPVFPAGSRKVRCGPRVRYTVPQRVNGCQEFILSLRVTEPMRDVAVTVRQGDRIIGSRKMRKALPAEMIRLKVTPSDGEEDIEVTIE